MSCAIWDKEAHGYDEPADHGLHDPAVREVWRDLLLGVLPPAPARVADLGCGTATLTLLLADAGYIVDGIDFSPAMLEQARAKAGDRADVTLALGDASDPRLDKAAYDVVLCRHVLWALPDQVEVLRRWLRLLRPDGRLVLIEGSWSTGAGLTAERTLSLLDDAGCPGRLARLTDAAYWGREISDERYLVVTETKDADVRSN